MALLFSLKEFGQTFATRGRGAELRSELLSRAAGEDVATIDFTDITNVSYSFADEFVGVLVSDHEEDGPSLELVNMAGPVDRVLQRAISRRSHSRNQLLNRSGRAGHLAPVGTECARM